MIRSQNESIFDLTWVVNNVLQDFLAALVLLSATGHHRGRQTHLKRLTDEHDAVRQSPVALMLYSGICGWVRLAAAFGALPWSVQLDDCVLNSVSGLLRFDTSLSGTYGNQIAYEIHFRIIN